MINNGFNGYQMPGGMAMPQQPVQQMPQMKNLLSEEDINSLKKDKFTIMLKPEELMRKRCNHKHNNTFTLPADPNRPGYQKCTICGTSFQMVDEDLSTTTAMVEPVINLIETIKTVGVELPTNFQEDLGRIEAIVEMLPNIHHEVMKTWNEKYNVNGTMNNRNIGNSAVNLYQYINNPNANMGNPYNPYAMNNPGAYGFQQQPVYGYQQPQQGFNPYQQQAPQQPQYQSMFNGMGNQQPYAPYGQQPQQPMGYQQQPQQGSPFWATQQPAQQYPYGQAPQQPVQQPTAPQQQAPQAGTTNPVAGANNTAAKPAGGQQAPLQSYQPPTADKPVSSKPMQP